MNRTQMVNYAKSAVDDPRFAEMVEKMRKELSVDALAAYESGRTDSALELLSRAQALGMMADYLVAVADDL